VAEDPRLHHAADLLARAQALQEEADELRAQAFVLMAEASGRRERDEDDLAHGDGHTP
jgi:hypothetical protein